MFGFNEGLFDVHATLNGSFRGTACVFQRRHAKGYSTIYIAVVREQSDDVLFIFANNAKATDAWALLQQHPEVEDRHHTPFVYKEMVYQDTGYGYQNDCITMY